MPAPQDGAGEVAVIGTAAQIAGFRLAGAHTLEARDADGARAAWRDLPATVAVVFLSGAAAEAVGADLVGPYAPLTVVLPP